MKSHPLYRTVTKVYTTKAGTRIEEPIEKAAEYPGIESFCWEIGISKDTFYRWCKEHEELSDALAYAKCGQAHWLVQNGLSERIAERFGMFMAVNDTDKRNEVQLTESMDLKISIVHYGQDKPLIEDKMSETKLIDNMSKK